MTLAEKVAVQLLMENVTLGTSQTYTNDPINNTGGTGTAYINTWSTPTRLEVRELNDSIEMIYEETSLATLTILSLIHI